MRNAYTVVRRRICIFSIRQHLLIEFLTGTQTGKLNLNILARNITGKFNHLLGKVGVEVRVLKMQGAKDPDEFIKKKGAESFKALLTESRTGFEYKLESVLSKHDISQVEEKRN